MTRTDTIGNSDMIMKHHQQFKRALKGRIRDDGDGSSSSSNGSDAPDTSMPTSSMAAWARETTGRVPAAAAAASAPSGPSLYEELLRFHQENPEETKEETNEEIPKSSGHSATTGTRGRLNSETTTELDTKPAARSPTDPDATEAPLTPLRRPRSVSNGTLRVPVSRDYFVAKQAALDESPSSSSCHRSPLRSPTVRPREMDDSANFSLLTMDTGLLDLGDSGSSLIYPSSKLDASFHDDEALARELQIAEERAAAVTKGGSWTQVMAPRRGSHPPTYYDDAGLARELAGLSSADHDPTSARHTTTTHRAPVRPHVAAPSRSESVPMDEIAQQQKILREIQEAKERKQLEWALQESQRARSSQGQPRAATTTTNHGNERSNGAIPDWEASQRIALEEYERQQGQLLQGSNTTTTISSQGLSSRPPVAPSSPERDSLVRRGQSETAQAVRSGQAHIVRCKGCAGRLQAPIHYALVYCPKCGHVSPGEAATGI